MKEIFVKVWYFILCNIFPLKRIFVRAHLYINVQIFKEQYQKFEHFLQSHRTNIEGGNTAVWGEQSCVNIVIISESVISRS